MISCISQCLLLTTLCVLLDGSLERLWVGTDNGLDWLLAVTLEEEEGWHGADRELLCDLWDLVDVDLVEADVGVCVGEPVQCISACSPHLSELSVVLT